MDLGIDISLKQTNNNNNKKHISLLSSFMALCGHIIFK